MKVVNKITENDTFPEMKDEIIKERINLYSNKKLLNT